MTNDAAWVSKKPLRRIGGISEALSIASDLGFSVSNNSSSISQEDYQNTSTSTGEKSGDLIKVLRELTTVQKKIADFQVELQGRKDDKNVGHLTHVNEMEKKCESLARMTGILKDVIQNKDRIIARLQQPYSLDCIPVEAEYQKQFSELLMKAAGDYEALTASVLDFQWSQNFKEPPSVWGRYYIMSSSNEIQEMLRPIPVALASCTRFFEAMSAMRESLATLQNVRGGHSISSLPTTPAKDPLQRVGGVGDMNYVTPPPWRNESSFDDLAIRSLRREESEQHQIIEDENNDMGDLSKVDGTGSSRRLSWPPSVKNSGP